MVRIEPTLKKLPHFEPGCAVQLKLKKWTSFGGRSEIYQITFFFFFSIHKTLVHLETTKTFKVRIGEDIPQEEEIRAIQNERAEYEITRIGDRTER